MKKHQDKHDVFAAFKTITGSGNAQMGYRALRRNLKRSAQAALAFLTGHGIAVRPACSSAATSAFNDSSPVLRETSTHTELSMRIVDFMICGLVLVELYMQLRNPAVFKKPKTAKEATAFCDALRANPAWEFGDYEPEVAKPVWNWAAKTTTGFRHIIDARLGFTLRHHGVTHFATANEKHFEGFGFQRVCLYARITRRSECRSSAPMLVSRD